MILDLVQAMRTALRGEQVTVETTGQVEATMVARWCETSGNTLVAITDRAVTVRRGAVADPLASLPPERLPGFRLWVYTNFHCNLACDYCCVRSSPAADPRSLPADVIAEVVDEAVALGAQELYLTGGEPFLRYDLAEVVAACAPKLSTTILTNGMLFRGRRLDLLQAMPRSVALQISLDSATPPIHDEHRGAGSWQRAIDGIAIARELGFRVRVAATLTSTDIAEEQELRALLDGLGIEPGDQVLRRLARQGLAEEGLVVAEATVLPEVTVTADGVYWHPVAADDLGLRIADSPLPLAPAVAEITRRFREHLVRSDAAADAFPCA